MDRREPQAFEAGQDDQPLSDQELEAAKGGANLVAGLGGPDTRKDTDRTKWIDVMSYSW